MARYYEPDRSMPLRDAGYVEFTADNPGARTLVRDAIYEIAKSEDMPLGLRYENQEQYLRLMGKLERRLPGEDAGQVRCRILGEGQPGSVLSENKGDGWMPLTRLFGKAANGNVSDTILHRLFTTYMQPIVQPNGAAIGYEMLMRPLPEQPPFRPAELFETARDIGQHSFLDREARHSAIRMSASHLPGGVKRFINFLPSSLHDPATCLQGTFDLIKQTDTDPGDCVFEVMETEELDEPWMNRVFEEYRRRGVRLALDDVGSGHATLNAVDRLQPDYVKMDRKWVSNCDSDAAKQRYIDELLDRVSRFHGVVLAEGVEREEEWDYLKKAGVPLFQGYLFGRAAPVPRESTATRERVLR